MIDEQIALAVGGGCIIKCPNKEKTVSTSFTLEDLRQLGIPARPRGPLFSHPEHGLDSHNWSVYLSSRGRFEAGISKRSTENNFLKTSLNPGACGLFVCGITRECFNLLRASLAAGKKSLPSHRIHRAHLFSRRETARIFLEGPLLSREQFLEIFWMTGVTVLSLREENTSLESPENFKRLTLRLSNDLILDEKGNSVPRWFSSTPSSFCYGKAERDLILGLAVDGK
jgi:hypothetical protein